MDNLDSYIARLREGGCDPVRQKKALSFGDFNKCRRLLVALFRAVDKTADKVEWLPEYDHVADWMSNTQGKGLLLWGANGRGKSVIITGIVPLLLHKGIGVVIRAIAAEEFDMPCAPTWPTQNTNPKNIDYLCASPFPIIDDLGTESRINNYGEKYEGFNRVMNAAERRIKPVFISTNLTPDEIIDRYDMRTAERIIRLCRAIEFQGESLRR